MIETTLYLENISLMEQIQRLENLLAIRKESYEFLGYKVEMWRLDALIGSDVMHIEPEWMWNVVNSEGTATCFSGDSKGECEHWLADTIHRCPDTWLKDYHVDKWPRWPRYSTDISAAWQVVEKMRKAGFDVSIWAYDSPYKVRVTIESSSHGPQFSFKADSAPEAICKAALMVVSN